MNHKKIAAGIAAICITFTAAFAAGSSVRSKNVSAETTKFGDINGDGAINASDASIILSYYAYLSTHDENIISLEQYVAYGPDYVPDTPTVETPPNVSLKSGGDTFTVAAWNDDDIPYLLAEWIGIDMDTAYDTISSGNAKTPFGAKINFINFDVGGGYASEKYDLLFYSGSDLDVYFCEPDWAPKYLNDDNRTAPISKLGITDEDLADMYPYTVDIGKDNNGVLKGVAPFASPGGFTYRTDLAQQYLGVTTPEEMQAKVSSWDSFVSTGKELAASSNIALADSVGGMWYAYSCGRTQPFVIGNRLVLDQSVKDFADYAKTLWDCGGVTKNSQWIDEWTADGIDGKVMGYFTPVWGINSFMYDVEQGSGADWATIQGPAPYYWGGFWTVVNPATDNGNDAASFIRSSCIDTEDMEDYILSVPFYYFENNTTVMKTKTYSDNTTLIPSLHQNARALNFSGLITPYDAAIKSDIIYVIKEHYLENGSSWSYTENEIKNQIAEDIPSLDW